MKCYFHPDKESGYRCEECGAPICEECAVVTPTGAVCKACAGEALARPRFRPSRGERPRRVHPRYEHAHHHAHDRERPRFERERCAEPGRRYYSGLWFFLCSCVPGAGYMYLGLIRRGVAFMAAFLAMAFLCGSFGMGFLGLLIFLEYVVAFFDGVKKLKDLNAGYDVPDDVDDIRGAIFRNRHLLVALGVVFLAQWVVNAMGFGYTIRRAFPLLLLGAGAFALYKRRMAVGRDETDEEDFTESDDMTGNNGE